MRIVQTNKAYFPHLGGIETTIANLAEGMIIAPENTVEVLVCNNDRSMSVKKSTLNSVSVIYAPTFGKIASLPISPAYFSCLANLKGDILHIHEPFPLADMAVLLNSKIEKNFSRIVVSWHSDIVRQKWALLFYRGLLHRFLEKVDRILVSNNNLIDNSPFLSAYKNKCLMIPLGVKLNWVQHSNSRVERVKDIRLRYKTPLILFVGRLVYYKGIQYLIESMKALPNASLVIVGDGPLLAELENQIKNCQLSDRIKIIPPMEEDELHAFYEACDVFVLPSVEKSEAYGLVQIEAMACGKPVVSTELNTGTTFVNLHGITGLTVPPRNSNSLSDAIGKLINDTSLREALGRNAKERAFNEFTAEKMVERTLNVYKSLL
ncbi:MAG: glycosyltransferase [Bacteroidota bacterium]|nr:glycosyltransferase [Bacteroidota bacterium]